MAAPQERRRHPRLQREERAVVHRSRRDDDSPYPLALYGNTLDISASGMQLVMKQALLPGDAVEVVIHVQGHRELFHLSGETRWVAPIPGEKTYRMGVEIIETRSPDYAAWRELFG